MQIDSKIERPEDLSHEQLARFAVNMFHRLITHHTLWFAEVEHQLGMRRALEICDNAFKQSYKVQMDRMAKTLGFGVKDDIPSPLLNLSKEELVKLIDSLGINWLANDGLWFQAVEFSVGMLDAKRCNDSCWVRFSPFESWSIKNFLGMPEQAGIEGLKTALSFRMYARVNKQSIIQESPNSIVFQMNDCRVQSARKRRGLEDYSCKSAGVVEYRNFAETIDNRIVTECIGCPPDEHPEEWWCAWRFYIPE